MADEVARRLVHASGSVVPLLWVGNVLAWSEVRLVLVAGIALTLILEALRLLAGLEWVVYDKLTREYEQDNLAGYALYVIGGSLVGLVFDPTIAVPAMLMLTIGDPISGLLGSDELRTMKRPRVLVTMFAVCAALAYPFLPFAAVVAAALAATVADGIKPVIRGYVIDDNLTIPVVASLAAYLALVGLGEVEAPVALVLG
jgi:dolichol kinase